MCKTSYVSKSSKLSIVKGCVLDISTQLRARARTCEDAGRKMRGAPFSIALRCASALPTKERVPSFAGQVVDGKATIDYSGFTPIPGPTHQSVGGFAESLLLYSVQKGKL